MGGNEDRSGGDPERRPTGEPAEFGQMLREFRLRAGLSQQRLAEAVFDSTRKSSISELENIPSRVPQPHTLGRLAEALELSAEERRQFVAAAQRRRRIGPGRPPEPAGAPLLPDTPTVEESAAVEVAEGAPPPPPIVGSSPGRGSVRVLVVAAVIVLAAAAVGVVLAVRLWGSDSASPDPSTTRSPNPPATDPATPATRSVAARTGVAVTGATIAEPMDRQAVESPVVVRGAAAVSPDQRLWLLVHPVKDTMYYVSTDTPISVDQVGQWATRPRIGRGPRDEGYEFDLILIVSPAGGVIEQSAAGLPAGQYSVHLTDVPADSSVTHRIRVTLGKYNG